MKKSMVVTLAAGALLCGSLAYAAPKALTSDQMDSVVAGDGGVIAWFLPTDGASGDEYGDLTGADNGAAAVKGDDNEFVNNDAEAAPEGTAIAGDENDIEQTETTVDATVELGLDLDVQDNNLNTGEGGIAGQNNKIYDVEQDATNALNAGDNANIDIDAQRNEIEDSDIADSTVVQGYNNTTTTLLDESSVDDNEIEDDSYGVIAREATVTDSFNTNTTAIAVAVTVEDSFNVETNTLDISGQANVTAIANAQTLDDQYFGINLAVNSASATMPSAEAGPGGIPASNAATSTMTLTQTVVNSSIIVPIGLGIDGGTPSTF